MRENLVHIYLFVLVEACIVPWYGGCKTYPHKSTCAYEGEGINFSQFWRVRTKRVTLPWLIEGCLLRLKNSTLTPIIYCVFLLDLSSLSEKFPTH